MADKPRWTQKLEEKFVHIMGKGMTVKQYGNQEGAEGWRSSPGAMKWLKENYKKGGRKTRKTKKGGDDSPIDWDAAIEAAPEMLDNMKEDLKRQLPEEEYNEINFEDDTWKSDHRVVQWFKNYMEELNQRNALDEPITDSDDEPIGGRKKKTRKNKKKTRRSKKSTRK